MKAKKKVTATAARPVRSENVPVTAKMLYGVRDELIERMDSRFELLRSEIHGVKAENEGIKGEIQAVKSELKGEIQVLRSELKGEIHEIRSGLHDVKAEVHRLAILVEEQNARNIFVLDGFTALFDRQDRIEKLLTERL